MNITEFRLRLKALIEASGMRQQDVAQLCGVQQATLSRFLSGERGLSGDSILKLLPLLGRKRIGEKSSVCDKD